jgi:hypothetical protein
MSFSASILFRAWHGRAAQQCGALATYESAVGIKVDRERVRLLNAIAAIGFLAFRHGRRPEEAWCGRTLIEDLAWTNAALGQVGASAVTLPSAAAEGNTRRV